MNVKNLFRKVSVIGAFAMAFAAIPATIYAGYATTIISEGDVYLDGYINGVEGPLWCQDQVNYNAFLYGDELAVSCIPDGGYVAVRAGTDSDMLPKEYLYCTRRRINKTNVKTGYGGNRAALEMKCGTARETITVDLD
ncbi:MAG: hypothetical protein E7510_08860 [Ruminococcus sp.]|nr:hypothetical protein [Ruminococcus sp.]